MMMLRLAGAAGLVLCGWCAGDAVCQRTQRHIEALEQTLALLREIRQEIAFRRADLDILCAELVRRGVLDAPEGALRSAVPPESLTKPEAVCFRECVGGLGRTEAEQECARLDRYIRRFALFYQRAQTTEPQQRQLARRLGLAGGLAVAILWL